MQRESEECEATNAGERLGRLRLRGHAAAEGLAAGEERQAVEDPRRFGNRRADCRLRDRRRVGPLRASLHVGEVVAQRGDAALGEAFGRRAHERMIHAGAGTVREHIAGPRAVWAGYEPIHPAVRPRLETYPLQPVYCDHWTNCPHCWSVQVHRMFT